MDFFRDYDGFLLQQLLQWAQLLVVAHIGLRMVRAFERRQLRRRSAAIARRRRRHRLAQRVLRLESRLRQSRDAEFFARALLSRRMQDDDPLRHPQPPR